MHGTASLPDHDGEPPEGTKEIKIRVDRRLHATLHAVRLLRGSPISDTIRDALVAYLDLDPATYRLRRNEPLAPAQEAPLE